MELDFTAIQNLAEEKKPPTEPPRASQSKEGKAAAPAPDLGGRAVYKLGQEQRDREKAREAYKAYQENIKRAGDLRSAISCGLRRGEDLAEILLRALECISRMTGDSFFLEQGKADLLTVYGLGLRQPAAVQIQLKEAKTRLAMLTRPELTEELTDADARQRIERAADAHRKRIAALERELAAALE